VGRLVAPVEQWSALVQGTGAAIRNDRRAAVRRFERAARGSGMNQRLRAQLARCCLEMGDPAAARRIHGSLPAEPDRRDPDRLLLESQIAWHDGRYGEAQELRERALDLAPGDPHEWRTLARGAALLETLSSEWRPAIPGRADRPEPVRGRVLHLVSNALPSHQTGYTIRTQDVARSQLACGLEPHVGTRRAGDRAITGVTRGDSWTIDGVDYTLLASGGRRAVESPQSLTREAQAAASLVERLRPAVLQPATTFRNLQIALALRDRFGIKVVYEVRGFREETWLTRGAGERRGSDRYHRMRELETELVRQADAIVTLSDSMRETLAERVGIEPERVTVVPNAVDVGRFVPRPRDNALAARLGLSAPVVGYISSLSPYEGIDTLILAVAELRRRGAPVQGLIVGDGLDGERAPLEHLAASLGLDDGTMVFTGRVAHDVVADYYSLIDVFVVPRTRATIAQLVTPLKPYEAMAMERPLVVSRVQGLMDMVVEGETALVFEPEEAMSLADTVEPLLDDPERRAQLGRSGRAWVLEHRTWSQNGLRYRALFERLGVA
jgi:glycosyltransferase involved in cell wall biosynthesis